MNDAQDKTLVWSVELCPMPLAGDRCKLWCACAEYTIQAVKSRFPSPMSGRFSLSRREKAAAHRIWSLAPALETAIHDGAAPSRATNPRGASTCAPFRSAPSTTASGPDACGLRLGLLGLLDSWRGGRHCILGCVDITESEDRVYSQHEWEIGCLAAVTAAAASARQTQTGHYHAGHFEKL